MLRFLIYLKVKQIVVTNLIVLNISLYTLTQENTCCLIICAYCYDTGGYNDNSGNDSTHNDYAWSNKDSWNNNNCWAYDNTKYVYKAEYDEYENILVQSPW